MWINNVFTLQESGVSCRCSGPYRLRRLSVSLCCAGALRSAARTVGANIIPLADLPGIQRALAGRRP